MTTAADILEKAANTYREKNKEYGENWIQVGQVLSALFPLGIGLKGEQDLNRLHFLVMIIGKLSRYTQNWNTGHQDSIHDLIVYAAMLEALDDKCFPNNRVGKR